jgi:hypothetical protein
VHGATDASNAAAGAEPYYRGWSPVQRSDDELGGCWLWVRRASSLWSPGVAIGLEVQGGECVYRVQASHPPMLLVVT